MSLRSFANAAALLCLALLLQACAHRIPEPIAAVPVIVEPLRLSAIVGEGDAVRRASLQLTLRGIDEDSDARPNRAMGQYLRAIQVDPNNPYAYLAIARHHAASTDPSAALPFLDKSAALLATQGNDPRVEAHLHGLRGQSMHASGDVRGALPHLEDARRLAPQVWSDGRLDAAELR